MNQETLALASKKLKQLQKQYDGFTTVILDNWRGNRFIFDTSDVKNCSRKCKKCPLYNLLKKETGVNLFSAALLPASPEDKKIFGPQPMLNCKTLNQYKKCYANWLIKKISSIKQIKAELSLIRNLKILYSKQTDNLNLLEKKFKQDIIMLALSKTNGRKNQIIKNLATKMELI